MQKTFNFSINDKIFKHQLVLMLYHRGSFRSHNFRWQWYLLSLGASRSVSILLHGYEIQEVQWFSICFLCLKYY